MKLSLFITLLSLLLTSGSAWAISGEGYPIERIEVRGNEKTKPEIILRALTLRDGDVLSSAGVDASKQALEQTRLFKTVHLASKPGKATGHAVLVVYVVEKTFGELGVSYHAERLKRQLIQ